MIKKILISFLILLTCLSGYSQTYPVQATTTIIPPYSVYLADYITPGSERLALNIFLADINRPELNVRLRLRIEGSGIRIETKPEYLPPPMVLQGGVPERLIAADLINYFNPGNLNFQGITRQQFEKTGALPEGVYQFCFEVLEYNRGVKISNSACAVAWLILNDPPIINLPRNGEKLKAQDPQYITFQWTPRHTGSPNSAFTTEYEFSLVEIWPEGRNPNDAILTTPPIYETTTQSTTLIYGPAETPLEPGRHYAFRIRAKSIVGIEELDLFKNQGYSQTHMFIYGDPCNLPDNISAQPLSSTRFKLDWQAQFNHTSFAVRYREADTKDAEWIDEDLFFEELEVNSLKPGTTYEYQVGASCGSIVGEYSPVAKVTTEDRAETEFACGTEMADFNLDNQQLLESLQPGDYIYAGDFDVRVDSVTGSGGTFSGGGKAEIPFLKYVKVRTTFENIRVNTDYRVIEGNVYTYWDPNSGMIYDGTTPDEDQGETDSDDGSAGDEGESEGGEDSPADSVNIDAPIDNIFTDSTGTVIVVTTEGDTVRVEPGRDVVFTGPDGESTTVGPGGVTTVDTNENSGSGSGGNGGGSTDGTSTIADADFAFGPLSIRFAEPPESSGADSDGYCKFENVKASFIIQLNGQDDLSLQGNIDSARISFKKHCENDEYKDVSITWSHKSGVKLGSIKFIDVSVTSIDLDIDAEGKIKGSVGLNAALNEDKLVDSVLLVKKGINGDFKFNYNETSTFKGFFSFGGIKDINIDLVKQGQVLGSLSNGVFNDEGILTGDVSARSGVVKYQSDGLTVSVDKFDANITYSLLQGLKINAGTGQFTFSRMQGLEGTLLIGLDIREDIFTTSIISNNLSGYGLAFSNMNIRALMTRTFEVKEVSGSFKIRHAEINGAINIQEFEFLDGKLTKFQGNGQVIYDGLTVNITNTNYNVESDVIVIDANVEVKNGDMTIAASVEDFTIDRQGNVNFGGYNASVSGSIYCGPLTVAITGETEQLKGGTWREYEAEASFRLKMKTAKGVDKEKVIAGAKVKFTKHKNKDIYRALEITMDGTNIPIGEIYGIKSDIKGLNIKIASDGEFTSDPNTVAENVTISGESFIKLKASLTEDKKLHQLVTLKKGLEGEFKFNFEAGKEFKGSFDFGGIKKVNLLVEKKGQEIASLRNGTLSKEGILTGKITALQGASYSTGGFDVKVDKLEMDVQLNFADSVNRFNVHSGLGKLTVTNITGVEGTFKVGLNYGVDNNFAAELLTSESSVSAFGMTLKDLNVKADFNDELELKKIEGNLKASHPQFNADLNISKFKLESGELKVWEASGAVAYKNFNFELTKSSYVNQKLSITAKVEIDDVGKLAVDKFIIDKDGAISVGRIAGELKKPMVAMKFDATFKDSGFHGKFDGDIKFIAVSGALDFGTEKDYTYGYLRLAAEADKGIPLGPTGLQLTKVGGQLGYNYYLNFNAGRFTGGPRQHNYLIGLTLGVSDVANMFSAEGTSVVQFGNDKLQLSLLGSIQAPRNNPVIKSDFNVNYYLPDNTIDGSLQTEVSIPANSGFVFETTSPASVNFAYGNENWSVEGGVRAALFREITFVGNTSITRSSSKITGYLSGQASYYYSKSFSYDWTVANVEGSLELGFNSSIRADLNENGFSGRLAVNILGSGSLRVYNVLGSVYGSASVTCNGEVSYQNNQGYLKGDAKVTVQSTLVDFERSVSIEKSF
ncbi:hypothetical protein C900_05265 [Fulvivirga imtechensis AK7]|uniref:Fibronectin type-III domain-containing protein n=1 Tax=Fulvivirga imtechensis AK7 TaxID=1237149 RepID=L8JVZ6_9BACT|nr:fibronectin type III domain-containing protein [Fulvivirga imtechensis]ELR73216.1 hypothetical protein C900_05265 [Fulvivirga imtechensis AK7]